MRTERDPTFPGRRGTVGLGLVLTAVLLAGACGSGGIGETATPAAQATTEAPTHVGTLRMTASKCTLAGVDGPITPGPVAFKAVNETDALAAFNIARIEEGHSYAQLAAHIKKEIRLAEAGKPGLGHPSFAVPLFEVVLQPGESGSISGTVQSGTHGIACARVYERVGELRPTGAIGPLRVK